jgi:hypothetical protein
MPGAKLTDAQYALACDYGFDSWPKLARHVEAIARPEIAQHERMSRDMVAVWHRGDEAAAARLNDLFHSAITVDQIRDFLRDRLFHLPDGAARLARFDVRDARFLIARLFAFEDWDALVTAGAATAPSAPGLASTPPFHRIDSLRGIVTIQQPMSRRDWEALVAIMRERGLTGLEASKMMDDEAMALLAVAVPQVRVLKLHGSNRLTDEGLRHLASLRDLEEIELGGWHSSMTDAGFAALSGLPRLRAVHSWWSRKLTDAGVKQTLASLPAIEDANFGGTSLGDGLIEAMAGKPGVWRVFCGDGVTDAGLARLAEVPRLRHWQGGERTYGLMDFGAGPTYLAVKGPFTANGLRSLSALDGLFALNVHWTSGGLFRSRVMTSADLGLLSALPNLGFLAVDGDRCDDDAMRQIGRLPALRMLLAQEPSAGDEGFIGLAKSATLEYLWGRECPHLTGRGFRAMASMPSLKGLAVSCKFVDDGALALLPRFPALRSFMPMDVTDEGFRHIGQCEGLEELWCMYCRDTGDAATEHIPNLKLRTYYAGYSKITDRSLEILSRMPTLERMELEGCQGLTDVGVRGLATLPGLREIRVEGCRNVTRAGVTAFGPAVRVKYSTE